jgi:RTX calcium-binding nonapeptide repeat (4 copies)
MSMEPRCGMNLVRRGRYWRTLMILAALLVSVLVGTLIGPVLPLQAAFIEGSGGPNVLIGRDDDNVNNPTIQPPDVPVNQSLNNTDILQGGGGNDVLIGLLGNDVLHGGPGGDILIGGIELGVAPNSDIIFGDEGNDVNIWQGGDGSDAFIGGPGLDAMVFGNIDRVGNMPTLSDPVPGYPQGVPTANVSGQGGFCTLEPVEDPSLGYEFLVRFFVRATGNLAVTIRLAEVEQVFCTSQAGGQITFADLTQADPQFVVVTLEEVEQLNHTVAQIIR